MLPREPSMDTLIFLGDLIDRGPDVPGGVEHVLNLCRENPETVICLRGNHEQMLASLRDKILVLDDETVVLPGHGPHTTIGRERASNPFLHGLAAPGRSRGL